MPPKAALAGGHFMNGDEAIAEGAIAAGRRFFAAYPITPQPEIAERLSWWLPGAGGMFIQMEDEIVAMAATVGGAKAMTATSGPGFSLTMENPGLALMTETPCVVANVQRAAPSTGLPTAVGQGDMMQARWGSHGHYEIVAPCPTYGRRNKIGKGLDELRYYAAHTAIRPGAGPQEAGIVSGKPFLVGKFVEADKPTYLEMHAARAAEMGGAK